MQADLQDREPPRTVGQVVLYEGSVPDPPVDSKKKPVEKTSGITDGHIPSHLQWLFVLSPIRVIKKTVHDQVGPVLLGNRMPGLCRSPETFAIRDLNALRFLFLFAQRSHWDKLALFLYREQMNELKGTP